MSAHAEPPTVPDDELELTFARSSGPGGQHANKASTKVTLRWDVVRSATLPDDVRARFLDAYGSRVTDEGLLVLACQESRSRDANVRACLERLAQMILEVWEPPTPRRPTRPTRSSKERRLKGKRRRSEKKRLRRPPREDSV